MTFRRSARRKFVGSCRRLLHLSLHPVSRRSAQVVVDRLRYSTLLRADTSGEQSAVDASINRLAGTKRPAIVQTLQLSSEKNLSTPALYVPKQVVVDVIQDGEERAFVKFPDGKAIWVRTDELDFDDLGGDDDWGDEFDDSLDSPTDFDEYEMNPDDCLADAGDQYDIEYDR